MTRSFFVHSYRINPRYHRLRSNNKVLRTRHSLRFLSYQWLYTHWVFPQIVEKGMWEGRIGTHEKKLLNQREGVKSFTCSSLFIYIFEYSQGTEAPSILMSVHMWRAYIGRSGYTHEHIRRDVSVLIAFLSSARLRFKACVTWTNSRVRYMCI